MMQIVQPSEALPEGWQVQATSERGEDSTAFYTRTSFHLRLFSIKKHGTDPEVARAYVFTTQPGLRRAWYRDTAAFVQAIGLWTTSAWVCAFRYGYR